MVPTIFANVAARWTIVPRSEPRCRRPDGPEDRRKFV
jgi:hypothetical protein